MNEGERNPAAEYSPQEIEAWRLKQEIARLVDNGWQDKDFDFRNEHREAN